MRARDFITEGMTFSPGILKDYVNQDGTKGEIITSEPWWVKRDEECFVCDGTGKRDSRECDYCKGAGVKNRIVSTAPELDVSNANGYAIMDMLGVEPDDLGIIYNKDLADVMRRLILLKNKGAEEYTKAPSTSQGPMRATKDDSGMTRIGRGATMHDFGRSQSQVERYIDKLIEIVRFAQKNNAHVSWA